METRSDHVLVIYASKVSDDFVVIGSAEYKPRIALVRPAPIGGYREPTLQKCALDTIKLSKLLLAPIVGLGSAAKE